MSITSLNSSATSSATSGNSSRTELHERIASSSQGVGATLTNIAEAAAGGVSATVSFSGMALHALEHAGEAVVDGVEDLAIGAWHAVQGAAQKVEQMGEAVVDAVETGAHEIATTARTVGRELGHYASVGAETVGEGVSELASGTVLAASATGKTLMALI
jgi:hypothetical protein